jgi:rhodanese-related sulfurtransferase
MPDQTPITEFLKRRKENPKAIVIDVRDDDKWEEGHIPGAIHIYKNTIEEEIEAQVPDKNAEIFCHCGGGQSGPRAAEALAKLGYKHVSAIQGGFRSYKSSGENIEK